MLAGNTWSDSPFISDDSWEAETLKSEAKAAIEAVGFYEAGDRAPYGLWYWSPVEKCWGSCHEGQLDAKDISFGHNFPTDEEIDSKIQTDFKVD